MKYAPINNCKSCPNCKKYLTKGYGYAMDFVCVAAEGTYKIEKQIDGLIKGRVIAGNCEWNSEEPQDGVFPEWCPL